MVAGRYRWDDFLLDLDAYRLERAGLPLALEPKAFNLLVLMIQRPGHLFTKQEIFDAVWPDTAVTDHALTRVVAQLRRVLGDEAREAKYIETVPTRGYRWVRPVEEVPPTIESHGSGPDFPADARPEPLHGDAPAKQRFVGRWAAVAVTLLLGAVVLFWAQRDEPTSALGGGTNGEDVAPIGIRANDVQWPVQITTHAGLDLQPALSPQGDAVAFVSDRTGALEIHVRVLGGTGTETMLTSDRGQNVQPAWSPDGKWLAFHSYRKGGIWIMPARGGIPRQVAPVGSNPAWSPDGQRIAFQSDEHADVAPSAFGAQSGSAIWLVSADGTGLRQITRSGQPIGGHAAPAWTSDARHLAFAVFEGGSKGGVWIVDLASGATKPVAEGHGLFEMVFAPDDSALYVAGGEAVILRIPFDPTTGTPRGARELIPVPGVPGVRGLSIAADGKRIAFGGVGLSSQIWSQPIARDGSPTGSARALTADTSRRNSLPAVSPDGSKVAYMSTRRGEPPNIWVMDSDGGNGIQVTADETAEGLPNWFPDGRRVAYLSERGESKGVWSVDITTRREELVFDMTRPPPPGTNRLSGRVAELELSPTMRRAAFSLIAPPEGHRTMYVATIDPYTRRALTDGTASVGYPAWSPDERQLAVEIKDGSSTQAGVIDLQTGVLKRLTNERGQTWVRSWSPDSTKIVVAALRQGVWDLRWIDVKSGQQGTITPAGPPHVYVRYPEWSSRGDVVLFERGELRGNIWMLALR